MTLSTKPWYVLRSDGGDVFTTLWTQTIQNTVYLIYKTESHFYG